MNQQAGPPVPPQKGGAGKWLMGCGIAALVVIIAFAGVAWWGANKMKDFMAEFEAHPELGIVAGALLVDQTYEKVSFDAEGGTLTVKNTKTGEESVWRTGELDPDSDVFYLIDDKGRRIDFNENGEGGNVFVVGEVIESAAMLDEAPVEEEAAEVVEEEAPMP